jgi:hypothetical protein
VASEMNKREIELKADSFLQGVKDRIAALPLAEIKAWPNWPNTPSFSLEVPPELSSVQFILMKDILRDGRIRIAIQCYHYRFLGYGRMTAEGFVLSPDGSRSELTQQDIWDVT